MPDVITAEERALINAALPRKQVIAQGVTSFGGYHYAEHGRLVLNEPVKWKLGFAGSRRNKVQRRRGQVKDLLGQGLSQAEIARRLGVKDNIIHQDVRVLQGKS